MTRPTADSPHWPAQPPQVPGAPLVVSLIGCTLDIRDALAAGLRENGHPLLLAYVDLIDAVNAGLEKCVLTESDGVAYDDVADALKALDEELGRTDVEYRQALGECFRRGTATMPGLAPLLIPLTDWIDEIPTGNNRNEST